jgi:hypothetical protein
MSLPHGIALFAVVLFGLGAGVALHGIARAGDVEREARLTAARGELDRERIAASDARRAEAHVAATRERLVDLAARRNAARRARNMGLSLCLAAFAFGAFALVLVREGDEYDDLDDFEALTRAPVAPGDVAEEGTPGAPAKGVDPARPDAVAGRVDPAAPDALSGDLEPVDPDDVVEETGSESVS